MSGDAFVRDPDFDLYIGDVRDVLAGLPDGSVDCCVTSPPYWGLRDYAVDGQLGLEATHARQAAERCQQLSLLAEGDAA